MAWFATHLPHISPLMALTIVAAIGYIVGRWTRRSADDPIRRARRELRRAHSIAGELDRVATKIRRGLSRHHVSLNRFKQRLGRLESSERNAAWKELCQQAEEILGPTMRLATQVSEAYDQLRQQTAQLMSFTELRSDPLTGVGNRRALDEALTVHFGLLHRYNSQFSLAMFDIDHFKRINDKFGHPEGDRILQRFAQLVDESVRETDIVARYGGEEFIVILPQTDLDGCCTFAERLRQRIEQQFSFTISGGVAAALDGDTPESLLARLDAALYHAKSAGRNCVFRHTGEQVEGIVETPSPSALT